jgi:ATP-binding cassette subfamily C (CFTR/MRP) protein 1
MVYSHTVEARAAGGSNIDGVTLMGADIERIVSSLIFVHEIWASTLDICVAVVLLERQLGVACLVPAIVVIGNGASESGITQFATC